MVTNPDAYDEAKELVELARKQAEARGLSGMERDVDVASNLALAMAYAVGVAVTETIQIVPLIQSMIPPATTAAMGVKMLKDVGEPV